MDKTRVLPFLILLFGVSACSGGITVSATPDLTTGIEGHVTTGPVCPGPAREGDTTCQDQPYQAKIIILNEDNSKITEFTTEEDGYFKVNLSPGTYIIHPEAGKPLPLATDQTVIVSEGHFTEISIQYDTGIR